MHLPGFFRYFILFPLVFLLLALVLSGCAQGKYARSGGPSDPATLKDPTVSTTGAVSTDAFSIFSGEYEITPAFKQNPPGSIAVLPFDAVENHWKVTPDGKTPQELVRRGMYNHLASLPFQDLELNEVDLRLAQAGLTDTTQLYSIIESDPRRLKQILGVDAVIVGTVTDFDRLYLGLYSQALVGCMISMYDLDSGQLLWRAEHSSPGSAGGVSLNPLGLAVDALKSLWNLRDDTLLTQTDVLFREIVATLETGLPPTLASAGAPPPEVDLFAVINANKPFMAGDSVSFRLVGDPGCSVIVDIKGVASGVELRPLAPEMRAALWSQIIEQIEQNHQQSGHALTPALKEAIRATLAAREVYEGTYTVKPGDNVSGITATARTSRSGGGRAETVLAAPGVILDTTPPGPPSSLAARPLDGRLQLSWTAPAEADLAQYEVHLSATPLDGFFKFTDTQNAEAVVDNLLEFEPAHIKVRAVDKAGNQSEFTPVLTFTPVPDPAIRAVPDPGPLLSGELHARVILRAAMSPYTVQDDFIVGPGGVLYVEPGVTLLFASGAALRIQGGELLVFGRSDKPVLFQPQAQERRPGAYQGLVLDKAARAVLNHARIEYASTGIYIRNCSPELTAVAITHSAQAGLHLADHAKPLVRCSLIQDNEGMGGLVAEGAGVAPRIHDNAILGNAPFQVQNFSPLLLELSGNFWGNNGSADELFVGDIHFDPSLPSQESLNQRCVQ